MDGLPQDLDPLLFLKEMAIFVILYCAFWCNKKFDSTNKIKIKSCTRLPWNITMKKKKLANLMMTLEACQIL